EDCVAEGAKAIDHLRPRHAVALAEERKAVADAEGPQPLRCLLHHLIAGKEHKGPPLATLETFRDLLEDGILIDRWAGGGVGHVAEQVQLHLAAIVEGATQLQRGTILLSQPALKVAEAGAAPDAQGGAGEDDCRHPLVELLPQRRTDLDGSAGKL